MKHSGMKMSGHVSDLQFPAPGGTPDIVHGHPHSHEKRSDYTSETSEMTLSADSNQLLTRDLKVDLNF